MIAPTHVAFASTLYLAGATVLDYRTDLIGWAIACAASLGPDVDLPTSRLGRMLWFLSTRLERDYGHRTVTHSLIGLLMVTGLAFPLAMLDPLWFGCAVGGYWSHIWLDMANIRGVDLLWPSPIRVVMPGNRNWRVEVGSKAEMVIMALLLASSVPLYPLSEVGFRGGLQALIRNFDIAYDEFVKGAGTHWYALDLEATDNLTLRQVKCRCPVLGAWQGGLIVLHEGEPRAVGASQVNHNLYPVKARLLEGEPLRVIAQRVDMRGRSLRWLLARIDKAHTYYISGELRVGDKVVPVSDLERYDPASYRGDVLRLRYAREQELEPYLDLVAAEGEVFVQFWLRPGEVAVELNAPRAETVDRVPSVLKRYL